MIRFGPAFVILLAVAGCGPAFVATPLGTSRSSGRKGPEAEPQAEPHATGDLARAEADAAPDFVRIPEATLGFSRMGAGRGYFWVGYTAADIGQEDMNRVGAGDGFSLGTGFRLTDAGHTYVEFAWEKSLKHAMDPAVVVTSDATIAERGTHERSLLGLRTSTAARAREPNQPRPYVSYGIGYNHMVVRLDADPTPAVFNTSYIMNGIGYYFGLGCEFPFEGRGGLSVDAKFHTWVDANPPAPLSYTVDEATFGSVAFSLFWMNRF